MFQKFFKFCLTKIKYNFFEFKLKKVSKENTNYFSFENKKFITKVVDVYDGDTITVVFKFNGKRQKFKIRMNGYDTPELRTKNLTEKKYAIHSKNKLKEKIDSKIVKLVCGKFDKYGRILGTVFTLQGENINEYMIHNKYGITYTGKTKMQFDESLFNLN